MDLVISVPCKYVAALLEEIGAKDGFQLVYPSREEEGLGIAAGAWLAGRRSVMVIQNSGLGNMVNAFASLNRFYGIPLCAILTHRGDEHERVPAQRPMGEITPALLDVLGIPCIELASATDLPLLEEGLGRYERGESVAFLTKKTFWTV